ncbi:hypothetical protein ACUM5W_005878 [Pseudomonas aeruginosa]|uniref:hypothetical protein n=1 Tax=Pseudomonas aeruginosa TaxID=287 RepID=UPI0019518366|nr:hypothetical protein [Pseudomonas aeruginosa]EKU8275395.1 hypothetical protein [Pseudomonas aeruginosa]EKU8276657.1 hypothetical protein [Pseudomonas aeruginosa]ELF4096091.1 hypothetical protein [Pseudomonas aeruginosa]ELF4115240.1 hypothetical protein [Pseudomonas aeruginosa]ELF4123179.1 hypothetical protein [Pseudomonas aeruginosa]
MSNLIPAEILAPEVGALVNYGTDSFGKEPGRYRVTGYMCRVESKPHFGDDFLGEILFDSCRDFQGSKMRYCLREQATHVTLTGIAGAIAPIGDDREFGKNRTLSFASSCNQFIVFSMDERKWRKLFDKQIGIL